VSTSDSALSSEDDLEDYLDEELQPIEHLPDDIYTYSAAPTAGSAVPILSTEYSAAGEQSSHDMLGQLSSEYVTAESGVVESESGEVASVSTDSEEDEEGSLLDRWYAAPPDELCR